MLMINRYSPWHEAPLQKITKICQVHGRTSVVIKLSPKRTQGDRTGPGLDKISKTNIKTIQYFVENNSLDQYFHGMMMLYKRWQIEIHCTFMSCV